MIDLYKVDMVIFPHHVAFVQRNSDQNILIDDTMCTNRDIVDNNVFKKPESFTMDQPSCPLNTGNTINASDNFARVYKVNHPTHYPRASTNTHLRGVEQLAP